MDESLQKIMFIDIETVPQTAVFDELPEEMKHLWEDKYSLLQRKNPEKYGTETTSAEGYFINAGIFAEFGRIVCISVGYIFYRSNVMHFRTKSFVYAN